MSYQAEGGNARPLRKFNVDFRFEDSDIIVSFKGVYANNATEAQKLCREQLKVEARYACIGLDRDDRR